MKVLHKVYTVYTVIVFVIIMIILLPMYLIIAQIKSWHKYNHVLNRIWARTFYALSFMPFSVEFKQKLDTKKSYIYCANHFSYFDIASMVFAPTNFMFTGKASLVKAPLLGFIFKKFHITVDRFTAEGRKSAIENYYKTLDEGKSLVIYPEGGIYAPNPPQMGEFKHGAFTAAITKKTPIVPVTIPYNWIILPDDGKFLIRRHSTKVIFHEPIETAHLTIKDLDDLKQKVYRIIQGEIDKYNNYEHRQRNIEENSPLSKTGH
jgi:1-acyl-sn-glycerol-3-phosphate acyltransferase